MSLTYIYSIMKKGKNQVIITNEQKQRMRELRRIQARIGLSPQQEDELNKLEPIYIGAEIIPVLRDEVEPLVKAFGAPLEVAIGIDSNQELHYQSRTPGSPSAPAFPLSSYEQDSFLHIMKREKGQVIITTEQKQRMRELRRIQASTGLSPQQEDELNELEPIYIGAEIIPVLRDEVEPLVKAFGAPLEVAIGIDSNQESHYRSKTIGSPSGPAFPL